MKNWDKLYHDILQLLRQNLPDYLTYHNVEHTLHVIKMSEFIARQEHVSEYDISLIKVAALFHDKGFIHSDADHEEKGVQFASQILPEYGYSAEEISKISSMIRATAIPQDPKNHLDQILADADLEYLGTDQFKPIADTLFHELKFKYPDLTMKKWDQIQINFLKNHHYHTQYCIKNRTEKKEENLRKLIESQ